MPTAVEITDLLQARYDGLAEWLRENAPECQGEQRHLHSGTDVRAYWHYGYLAAVNDVLRLLDGSWTEVH